MLSVRLPVNNTLLVVKFLKFLVSQKFYIDFQLCVGGRGVTNSSLLVVQESTCSLLLNS